MKKPNGWAEHGRHESVDWMSHDDERENTSKSFDGKPFLEDPDLTLYNGDALEVLRTLPDGSVQMCVTSPPFYGLRDYGTGSWVGGDLDCDHIRPPRADAAQRHGGKQGNPTGSPPQIKDPTHYGQTCGKCGASRVDQQIGLEETPEQWVEKLVAVFREVRRVLRSDGTCWVEVGDSYGGIKTAGRNDTDRIGTPHPDALSSRDPVTAAGSKYVDGMGDRRSYDSGYKPKDLIGAPWMLAFALRADGWYLRSDIVWSRPNPMPESVTDRPTKSHSYVFLLSKSARYYYDLEAIREPEKGDGSVSVVQRQGGTQFDGNGKPVGAIRKYDTIKGANSRSVWQIATQPYPEAHFATYPEELVRRCILAGSSERGCCPECGAPWTREVERGELVADAPGYKPRGNSSPDGLVQAGMGWRTGQGAPNHHRERTTTGWHPSCDCHERLGVPGSHPAAPVPCAILDCFFGSGTTGLVARKHGRRTIGIELSSSYCELAARRLQQLSLLA